MGSAGFPFVPTDPISVINFIMAGCTPSEHKSRGKVSIKLLFVFSYNCQMIFDGLPIFIDEAKNHVTATCIEESHFGIHLMHSMCKLIVASFARQTRRIRVA
jgi:hypothetical protein